MSAIDKLRISHYNRSQYPKLEAVMRALSGLICCIACAQVQAALLPETHDILHFSAAVPTSHKHFQHRQQLIAALCSRLRWHCSLESYAPKRAEQLLRNGNIDGEVGRDISFANTVPQAIRVPTHFAQVRFVALIRKDHHKAAQTHSWESLRHLRVSYLRDYHFAEKYKEAKTWHAVDKDQSCLALLQNKRTDACLLTHGKAMQLLRQAGNKGHQFRWFDVKRETQYLYLARHRAELLPQIDAMLQVMRRDGSLDAIYRRNLGGLEKP